MGIGREDALLCIVYYHAAPKTESHLLLFYGFFKMNQATKIYNKKKVSTHHGAHIELRQTRYQLSAHRRGSAPALDPPESWSRLRSLE